MSITRVPPTRVFISTNRGLTQIRFIAASENLEGTRARSHFVLNPEFFTAKTAETAEKCG
jgi:hypothetical protein